MTRRSDPTDAYGLEAFREVVSRNAVEGFFAAERPVVITRAPGRLDLMGGIADYSGSLVLQYPIREATFAAAQAAGDGRIHIKSIPNAAALKGFEFQISVDEFRHDGKLASVADAKKYFAKHPDKRWAAYAAGAFVVLADALSTPVETGVRILISSEIPLGKGVSSSAALEVSVMMALGEVLRPAAVLECRELALLCQRVENEVVGAPCGVMDQMVSACGSENELVEILCQPAELRGTIRLPDELEIWGIDSDIRHSVAGADYATVRTAASMGYRIIAEIAGLSIRNAGPGRVTISDPKWNGYLANIDPETFIATFESELPESVRGREFVSVFYGVSDPFASIDPDAAYPVRAAAAHPIYENARVSEFAGLLRTNSTDLERLGSLMFGSHASYSRCGLGSEGTDLLVDLVRDAGPASGLFGAKITGGGSGGTVAVLGRRGSGEAVASIAAKYAEATGRHARIFSGSSPGAFRFGSELFNV